MLDNQHIIAELFFVVLFDGLAAIIEFHVGVGRFAFVASVHMCPVPESECHANADIVWDFGHG